VQIPNSDIERFKKRCGYTPNIDNPKSHSELLLVKKWTDRNETLRVTADKVQCRGYLINNGLSDILQPAIYIGTEIDDALMNSVQPCVVKANNGSGRNVFILSEYDKVTVAGLRKQWEKPYGQEKGEWCYSDMELAYIVEPLLWGLDEPHILYRWLCFGGVPCVVEAHEYALRKHSGGRVKPVTLTHTAYMIANDHWVKMDVKYDGRETKKTPRPDKYSRMKSVATQLSKPFDFVRVDLLEHRGMVRFSELTHYPRSGMYRFDPRSYDYELGKLWP
jgi:hypothetical protein